MKKTIKKLARYLHTHHFLHFVLLSHILFAVLYTNFLTNFATRAEIFPGIDYYAQRLSPEDLISDRLSHAFQVQQQVANILQENTPDTPIPTLQPAIQCTGSTANEIIFCQLIQYSDITKGQFGILNFTDIRILLSNADCSYAPSSIFCAISASAYLIPVLYIFIYLLIFVLLKKPKLTHTKGPIILIHFVVITGMYLITSLASITIATVRIQYQTIKSIHETIHTINQNPGTLGLETNLESITDHITNNPTPPLIISPTSDQEILYSYYYQGQPLTFANKYLLTPITTASEITQTLQLDKAYYPNNRLIIKTYTLQDLQTLIPIIAQKILYQTYPDYDISRIKETNFQIIQGQEYQAYQEKKQEQQKDSIRQIITDIRSSITQINNLTQNNNNVLTTVEKELGNIDNQLQEYVIELENEYQSYCIGFEEVTECQKLQDTINQNRKNILAYEASLKQTQDATIRANQTASRYKDQYQQDLKDFNEYLQILVDNPVTTENQLGVFFGDEDQILLKFQEPNTTDNPFVANEQALKDQEVRKIYQKYLSETTFASYLSTALHEYLHAAGFQAKGSWPTFLEEGYTEYLSMQAISGFIDKPESAGLLTYQDQVDVINRLLVRLDQSTLTDLYFTNKSKDELSKLLTTTYPSLDIDDFILKNEIYYHIGNEDAEAKQELKSEIYQSLEVSNDQ